MVFSIWYMVCVPVGVVMEPNASRRPPASSFERPVKKELTDWFRTPLKQPLLDTGTYWVRPFFILQAVKQDKGVGLNSYQGYGPTYVSLFPLMTGPGAGSMALFANQRHETHSICIAH